MPVLPTLSCMSVFVCYSFFLPVGLSLGIDITTTDRSKLTYAEQAIVTAAKAFRLQVMDCVFTVVKGNLDLSEKCLNMHSHMHGHTQDTRVQAARSCMLPKREA